MSKPNATEQIDPEVLLEEIFEHLHDAVAKTRKAEVGQRWEDPQGRRVLGATRHLRSQLEPLIEYLETRE